MTNVNQIKSAHTAFTLKAHPNLTIKNIKTITVPKNTLQRLNTPNDVKIY